MVCIWNDCRVVGVLLYVADFQLTWLNLHYTCFWRAQWMSVQRFFKFWIFDQSGVQLFWVGVQRIKQVLSISHRQGSLQYNCPIFLHRLLFLMITVKSIQSVVHSIGLSIFDSDQSWSCGNIIIRLRLSLSTPTQRTVGSLSPHLLEPSCLIESLLVYSSAYPIWIETTISKFPTGMPLSIVEVRKAPNVYYHRIQRLQRYFGTN